MYRNIPDVPAQSLSVARYPTSPETDTQVTEPNPTPSEPPKVNPEREPRPA